MYVYVYAPQTFFFGTGEETVPYLERNFPIFSKNYIKNLDVI